MTPKRFIVLLGSDSRFDVEAARVILDTLPEIILRALSECKVVTKLELAERLGVTRERLDGLLSDLGLEERFAEAWRGAERRRRRRPT